MKIVTRVFGFCFVLSAVLLCNAQSVIASEPDDMEMFTKGETVTLSDDKAYILVRNIEATSRFPGVPIFIRRLSTEEQSVYEAEKKRAYEIEKPKADAERAKALLAQEKALARGRKYTKIIPQKLSYAAFTPDYKEVANTYFFSHKKPYQKIDNERTLLVAVKPGIYVLYGQGYGLSGGACMCMGTVEFKAEPGVITDMGYFNSDLIDPMKKPSNFPWINEMAEGRDDYKAGLAVIGSMIVPFDDTMNVPEPIANLPRKPATYKAVGKLPNYMSMIIMRLNPVPGVLDYDGDVVVDVLTGRRL